MTIRTDTRIYVMDKANPPAAICKSGDEAVFETLDCFGNQIKSEEMLMDKLDWSNINPATGPLFIEGADAGDVLKVEILKIEIGNTACMIDGPGEGVLKDIIKSPTTRLLPIENGVVRFNERLSFNADPMIGVIGTAPEGEGIPTGTPGPHGGNMDCKLITEGAVIYLPVNVKGALLSMGDMHAVMGDGEVGVCGAEVDGKIKVRVTVLIQCDYPTPFLVNRGKAMTIFSAKDADGALDGAVIRMHSFLVNALGMNENEANMLMSVTGDAKICQIVDPEKTARFEMPVSVMNAYGYEFR